MIMSIVPLVAFGVWRVVQDQKNKPKLRFASTDAAQKILGSAAGKARNAHQVGPGRRLR